MNSETTNLNSGPLANAWLAANYDKKLTKQQVLGTNIVEASNYIAIHNHSHSHNHTHKQPFQFSTHEDSRDTISLRISSQLLYGIVKIYSRKSKYLIDDINDVLYKLKASFKLSCGVQLGSDMLSTSRIDAPPEQTTLPNLDAVTLKDQVSVFDLFYQEDLNLDEPEKNATSVFDSTRPIKQLEVEEDTSFTLDRSIEVGRNADARDDMDMDMDMDLDFNLDLGEDDNSIEQGRNGSSIGNPGELSFLAELDKSRTIFELESGHPVLGSQEFYDDFDEQGDEHDNNQQQPGQQDDVPAAQSTIPSRPRHKRTRITEDGEMIVPNRKLIVDSEENMQGGSMLQLLKENQEKLMDGITDGSFITLKLSDTEKLKLIQELAQPVYSKRRKLWNLDAELQLRCAELARKGGKDGEDDNDDSDDADSSIDTSLDLDISISETDESERGSSGEEEDDDEEEEEDDTESSVTGSGHIAKSTKQVAVELQNQFRVSDKITLETLMDADMASANPLGTQRKIINKKREASKCFFELLVLSTNNCISLEQEQQQQKQSEDNNRMCSNVNIRIKDRLYDFL
ncbi:uncharacterized protein LODBEIA_P20060 [Lodderomyces beijingensis]|uniref:Rad21/Rec8-like protein N-terminal domain-containing protein n=1 Tax=Lodderomyces beijingensis TaxID=1775926 RepID=A0ABP0ZHY9_9ASCO